MDKSDIYHWVSSLGSLSRYKVDVSGTVMKTSTIIFLQ